MTTKNLIYALLLLTLISCKKEILDQPETIVSKTEATSFRELEAQESFDWATEKNIALKVDGLPTAVPIERTIKVSSVDGTVTYYTGSYLMATTSTIQVKVPAAVKELKVSYGAIEKKVNIVAGKASFNFMPELNLQAE
jgi:hypothetical protein